MSSKDTRETYAPWEERLLLLLLGSEEDMDDPVAILGWSVGTDAAELSESWSLEVALPPRDDIPSVTDSNEAADIGGERIADLRGAFLCGDDGV